MNMSLKRKAAELPPSVLPPPPLKLLVLMFFLASKLDLLRQCLQNSLSTEKASGKVVLCLRGNGTRVGKGMEVDGAGGIAFILGNFAANGQEVIPDPHVLSATAAGANEAVKILNYIKSTNKPMAKIIPAQTVLHTSPAPFMASFTSRGPNSIDPNILKSGYAHDPIGDLLRLSKFSNPV